MSLKRCVRIKCNFQCFLEFQEFFSLPRKIDVFFLECTFSVIHLLEIWFESLFRVAKLRLAEDAIFYSAISH